ncbi:MAG TPA: MATE family efflux transporter [Oscillospiraceae bacterium]|nr:MATE family efflux transporter [Oscillospiraceae bacterium]
MDEEQGKNRLMFFETETIGRLMMKFSIPAIISMIVNSVYNIVDQIFIGQGVGYLGNAATTVTFPLVTISMAIGTLIADGCVAYFSLKLGEKKNDEAARTMGNGTLCALLAGIAIVLVAEFFMPSILKLFGAIPSVYPYAVSYGRITIVGVPFVCVSMTVSSLIRAEGNPRYAMASVLAGCVTNIFLDAWFVMGLKWGVAGAAWATVIGQALNCAIALAYIPRFRDIKFRLENMRPRGSILAGFLPLGVSSFFTQAAAAVVQICMNNMLVDCGKQSIFGSEIPLAAFGIVMKVNSIIVGIMVGLGIGSQPIVGYNYGAKNFARVKKTYLRTILAGTIVASVGCACFQLFPQAIVSIFGQGSALYNQFAVLCFRRFLCTVFLLGLIIPSGIFFQSIGKPVKAIISTMSRSLLFFIPSMYFLGGRYGLDGVLWAGPVSDVLAMVLVTVLAAGEMRRITALEHGESLKVKL